MKFAPIWDQLVGSLSAVPQSGLLATALAAVLLGVTGSSIVSRWPFFGKLLRGICTFGLIAVLSMVVLQLSRIDTRFNLAVPQLGLPRQVVAGGETHIEMAPDGHFWLRAEVNGVPANFLVDTGATLTAISQETADEAGLKPRAGGIPVRMKTANGPISVHIAAIDALTFGNVTTTGLDVIIAPGLGQTNVVGMNLLSRLASWRVENDVMTLVPKESD